MNDGTNNPPAHHVAGNVAPAPSPTAGGRPRRPRRPRRLDRRTRATVHRILAVNAGCVVAGFLLALPAMRVRWAAPLAGLSLGGVAGTVLGLWVATEAERWHAEQRAKDEEPA